MTISDLINELKKVVPAAHAEELGIMDFQVWVPPGFGEATQEHLDSVRPFGMRLEVVEVDPRVEGPMLTKLIEG